MALSKIDPAGLDIGQIGGRRNLIINGAMQVAQRSTSETGVTSNNYHTLDRYRLTASGATYNTSQQSLTVGQTDIPSQFKYFQRFNPTTANNNCGVAHRIEDVTAVSGETVTFSLYAKGTNPAGGELDVRLSQNFGSGGSTAVDTTVGTLTLTSLWQRFTYTVSVPSISGKTVGTNSYLELKIFQPDDDTGTSAFTFDSTGWQLEVGSVATPFEHRSYGEELALCQRYYYNSHNDGNFADYNGQQITIAVGGGSFGASAGAMNGREYPTTMRATPSVTLYHQDGTADACYRIDTGAKITGVSALYITRKGFLFAYKSNGFLTSYGYYYGYTADAEL